MSAYISRSSSLPFAYNYLVTKQHVVPQEDLWTGMLNPYDVTGSIFNPVRLSQVVDGTSNTFMLFESAGRPDLWSHNTRMGNIQSSHGRYWANSENWFAIHGNYRKADGSTNNGCNGQFVNCSNDEEVYAFHPGGANLSYGDGSVHFVKEDIDAQLFAALHSRAGGEVINEAP